MWSTPSRWLRKCIFSWQLWRIWKTGQISSILLADIKISSVFCYQDSSWKVPLPPIYHKSSNRRPQLLLKQMAFTQFVCRPSLYWRRYLYQRIYSMHCNVHCICRNISLCWVSYSLLLFFKLWSHNLYVPYHVTRHHCYVAVSSANGYVTSIVSVWNCVELCGPTEG